MVILSTHNICLRWEIKKLFSNTDSYLEACLPVCYGSIAGVHEEVKALGEFKDWI